MIEFLGVTYSNLCKHDIGNIRPDILWTLATIQSGPTESLTSFYGSMSLGLYGLRTILDFSESVSIFKVANLVLWSWTDFSTRISPK